MGGLERHEKAWECVRASNVVLGWVREGVNLVFLDGPPPSWRKPNKTMGEEEWQFADGEVKGLLERAAVRVACGVPRGVSSLKVVLKKGPKKFRLCIDMHWLGRYIKVPRFKFEGLNDVNLVLCPGDWMFSLDDVAGYHHWSIREAFRTYFAFEWDGVLYEWCVLPFGVASAPWVFTKGKRVLVKMWRAQGIRLIPYMDDFLFAASSREEALRLRAQVLEDLAALGWSTSWAKSQWKPAQIVEFLGFIIDTREGMVRVSESKVERILQLGQKLLGERGRVRVRDVAVFAGVVMSVGRAVRPVRWFTRALYSLIGVTVFTDNAAAIPWKVCRNFFRCFLTPGARVEIKWWLDNISLWNGTRIWREVILCIITTDASAVGWGAWWGEVRVSGVWPQAARFWSSNRRELMAVLLALRRYEEWKGGGSWGNNLVVRVRSDNSTTVACLNKLYSKSPVLLDIIGHIWKIILQAGVDIRAEWIPGVENVTADWLSRWGGDDECSLRSEWFDLFYRFWGPFTVDCMAGAANKKLLRFYSMYPCEGSLGVEVLGWSWECECVWVFPPFSLVGRVVEHMSICRARGAILVPKWEAQPWWPVLMGRALEWFVLPKGVRVFEGEEGVCGWSLICVRCDFRIEGMA